MDFSLTEEQEMLRKMARDYLAANCPKPSAMAKDLRNDSRGYPAALWKGMAELGWLGLAFPEKYGGAGGSFLDLTVLLEEMGRACLPGPFFSTVLLGGMSLLEAGSKEERKSVHGEGPAASGSEVVAAEIPRAEVDNAADRRLAEGEPLDQDQIERLS